MSDKKYFKQKIVKNYVDLLYMTPYTVSARDLNILLQSTPGIKLELWEEMNVLELELSNQNTVDIESLELSSFKSQSDAAFVKNRGILSIYSIHLCESDLNTIVTAFGPIIEKYSGFLCADTVDFTPVYSGSSKVL